MPLRATTKLHLNDGRYFDADQLLPADVDPSDPDLAELLRSGALVPAEGEGEPANGQVTRLISKIRLEKYEGDDADARAADPSIDPDDVHESESNLLLIGGASALWDGLTSRALTAFTNANAYLGVGDSTTAAADTQTDLQAATNKLRKAQDATYPQWTDSTSLTAAKSITYRATFATTDANFAWQEWGLFNASTAGRMFNRKVESLGTKTSAAAWVLTVTQSLA